MELNLSGPGWDDANVSAALLSGDGSVMVEQGDQERVLSLIHISEPTRPAA